MVTAYRRWACGLLAGVLVLLIAAGAVVWAADPCFYLRLPEGGKAVAFNERYQNAGLARQAQADTVVLGTPDCGGLWRQRGTADRAGRLPQRV